MTAPILNLMTESMEGAPAVFLERPKLANGFVLHPFPCKADEPVFQSLDPGAVPGGAVAGPGADAGTVRAAGRLLLESVTAHPGVQQALQTALATPDQNNPIYLRLRCNAVDSLPWECMHESQAGFLALDERWQIARLVGDPGSSFERTFEAPLNILVVLTAAGIDARPEWDKLHSALTASGVTANVRVLVSADPLKDHIESRNDPRVEVSFLQSRQHLLDQFETFGPQIVHFFCHGYAGEAPHLELATRGSHGSGQGHVNVEPRDFTINQTKRIWAVVLNCCEGGAAPGGAPSVNTGSLAFSLASVGFPAVIAMRRAVTVLDAHVFCGAFYSTFFKHVAGLDLSDASGARLAWPTFLHEPRRSLCERFPGPASATAADHPEWSLPMLYLGSDETKLMPRPQPEGRSDQAAYERAKLDQLIQAREELHPSTPQVVLDGIDAEIAAITARLPAQANGG